MRTERRQAFERLLTTFFNLLPYLDAQVNTLVSGAGGANGRSDPSGRGGGGAAVPQTAQGSSASATSRSVFRGAGPSGSGNRRDVVVNGADWSNRQHLPDARPGRVQEIDEAIGRRAKVADSGRRRQGEEGLQDSAGTHSNGWLCACRKTSALGAWATDGYAALQSRTGVAKTLRITGAFDGGRFSARIAPTESRANAFYINQMERASDLK